MLSTRVIPCLLLRGRGLVKTVRFKDPTYVGDPINAVRIFNDKEVDELLFLDILATVEGRRPPLKAIAEIAGECFMPLTYGGGVRTLEDMREIFSVGVEKICLCSAAVDDPAFVRRAADAFGSQSIVVSLDVRRSLFGRRELATHAGTRKTGIDPVAFALQMERAGAGELLLNDIDRDGTLRGYDLQLVRAVSSAVGVPLVACGGAGSVADLAAAVQQGGAAAAAAGSLFVFHGRHRAVLITYPDAGELKKAFG